MATRSTIAVKTPQGIKYVYCHFDGYPRYTGEILKTHYNTDERVNELIDLGAISVLKERVKYTPGEKHSFEAPARDVTIAHHRDRGEALAINCVSKLSDVTREEYNYLWCDGEWILWHLV